MTGTDGSTGTASLTVTAGPLDHIALSPATATIGAGGSQAYTATGLDAYNNSLGDVTGATTFTIGPNGSCTGTSCSATIAGAHTVTGTDGATGHRHPDRHPRAPGLTSCCRRPRPPSGPGDRRPTPPPGSTPTTTPSVT